MLAHELGHILSDHVLYMTALDILVRAGANLPIVVGVPLRAVRAVLLEWCRAAELSSRPGGDSRGARSADRLPHADGARRAECRLRSSTSTRSWPRRWSTRAGKTEVRPRPALLSRDRRHPLLRRAARVGGDALGPEWRVRPHRPRRVPPPGRGASPSVRRPATRRVLSRTLPCVLPRARRQRRQSRVTVRREPDSASPSGCAARCSARLTTPDCSGGRRALARADAVTRRTATPLGDEVSARANAPDALAPETGWNAMRHIDAFGSKRSRTS